jgi:hypothetical protein
MTEKQEMMEQEVTQSPVGSPEVAAMAAEGDIEDVHSISEVQSPVADKLELGDDEDIEDMESLEALYEQSLRNIQ